MRQKSVPEKEPATQVVKNIRRATRRHFSAEDKIRIVLEACAARSSQKEKSLPSSLFRLVDH
jgi:transposase